VPGSAQSTPSVTTPGSWPRVPSPYRLLPAGNTRVEDRRNGSVHFGKDPGTRTTSATGGRPRAQPAQRTDACTRSWAIRGPAILPARRAIFGLSQLKGTLRGAGSTNSEWHGNRKGRRRTIENSSVREEIQRGSEGREQRGGEGARPAPEFGPRHLLPEAHRNCATRISGDGRRMEQGTETARRDNSESDFFYGNGAYVASRGSGRTPYSSNT